MSLPFRSRVEHTANPVLERLNRLPRWTAFLVALALMVAGVLVPRVGFLFTAVVALFVGFLVYYTWPRMTPPERLMRLAVLTVAVVLTVVQAAPRG